MSQPNTNNQNNQKKTKHKFSLFGRKKKDKNKQIRSASPPPPSSSQLPPTNNQQQQQRTRAKSDDEKDEMKEYKNNDILNNNAISDVVMKYQNILSSLKQLCEDNNNTHHHMDVDRFHKIMHWVDFNDSHLQILKNAWRDGSFWPFLSTEEATEQVSQDKQSMIIRLSNTKAGTITVTRSAKLPKKIRDPSNGKATIILEDIVKHKRYYPSISKYGKIILTGSNPEREVTWDGLLAYLKQKECCICLEELKHDSDVYRLNCGHHFHTKCITTHIKFSDGATCPLCRAKIQNFTPIREPNIKTYAKLNWNEKKSKSTNAVLMPNDLLHPHTNNGMIQRAATSFEPDHDGTNSANVGGFSSTLGTDLNFSDDDYEIEDDYASTRSPQIQAAMKKHKNGHY